MLHNDPKGPLDLEVLLSLPLSKLLPNLESSLVANDRLHLFNLLRLVDSSTVWDHKESKQVNAEGVCEYHEGLERESEGGETEIALNVMHCKETVSM